MAWQSKNEYCVFKIEYFWKLWHNIKCNNKYNENKRMKNEIVKNSYTEYATF